MGRLMRKPARIGKYSVPALILLALAVGTAAATIYVVLQFTATVTVQQYPKVTFWKWEPTPGEKKNTFDELFNIFPGIKTVDNPATHGIFCDDTVSHTCYLSISGITNSDNIQTIYIRVYNGATVLEITWNYGEGLPTTWTQFTAGPGAKYYIQIEVTGSSTATVGTSSVFTFDMKVENP